MHKLLTIFMLMVAFSASSQCIKNISTNPDDPVNDEYLDLVEDFTGITYTRNPFLNTFNWADWQNGSFNSIPIDLRSPWNFSVSGNPDFYYMVNPFSDDMPSEYAYLRKPSDIGSTAEDRDFHWEDGWELLWMNLGYFPNEDPFVDLPATNPFAPDDQISPSPENVPYFILYNRYNGLMRVFANVWNPDDRYNNINVILKYTDDNSQYNELSGLLRHVENYDRTLDLPTQSLQMMCVRYQTLSYSQWLVAEFQLAYDPCVCFSKGEFQIEFWWINQMEINGIMRTVSIDVPITETNYVNQDFFNLLSEEGTDEPGSKIFQGVDLLYDSYKDKLDKYNTDLEAYNDYQNSVLKQVLDLSKGVVTTGVANLVPGAAITTFVLKEILAYDSDEPTYDKVSKDMNSEILKASKSAIGKGYDFLSASLVPKVSKPTKPSVPVATMSETVFEATIEEVKKYYTNTLYIPGTISSDNGGLQIKSAFAYPAYNVTPGIFALLEKPEFEYFETTTQEKEMIDCHSYEPQPGVGTSYYTYELTSEDNIYLKLKNPLKYAFNNNLDIDREKTEVKALLKIYVKNDFSNFGVYSSPDIELDYGEVNNFTLFQSFPYLSDNYTGVADMENIYTSGWVDIEDAAEYIFSLNPVSVTEKYYEGDNPDCLPISFTDWGLENMKFDVKKIELKILTDVYYDQIGWNEEQVNNTQVFTYLIYDEDVDGTLAQSDLDIQTSTSFMEYTPGTLYLTDETIDNTSSYVSEINGNTLYIRAENVHISGTIDVVSPWEVIVQAFNWIDCDPDAILDPIITLEIKKNHYNLPSPEMTQTQIESYCESSYGANTPAESVSSKRMDSNAFKTLNFDAELDFSLYPNPAEKEINISFKNAEDGVSLTLYSIIGSIIYEKKIEQSGIRSFQIDLSDMESGIYMIKIQNDQMESKTKKFIVK